MEKLETIKLYRGATSEIEFDFSNFDFGGKYCLFTMKSLNSDIIIKQIKFDEPKKYLEIFTDEFTYGLKENKYRYDIMYIVNDERYPQCLPSEIEVSEVVNEYSKNKSN